MDNPRTLIRLRYAFWLGAVSLVWATSFLLVANSELGKIKDLGSVLLGAASLALFGISIFIALLAIFGWQTVLNYLKVAAEEAAKVSLQKEIERLTNERVDRLEKERIQPMIEARKILERQLGEAKLSLANEVRGRAHTILGYAIGESSLDPRTFEPRDEIDKEKLREAVRLCEQGYHYLAQVGGAPQYLGLNNLVYYSCASGEERGRESQRELLRQAEQLRKEGDLHEEQGAYLILTACRAVLEFETHPDDREEAISRIRKLLRDGHLSSREQREAKRYIEKHAGTDKVTIEAGNSGGLPALS